jgi:hypothetical protein
VLKIAQDCNKNELQENTVVCYSKINKMNCKMMRNILTMHGMCYQNFGEALMPGEIAGNSGELNSQFGGDDTAYK